MQTHKVDSSNLKEVSYDGQNLQVKFKNDTVYEYYDVGAEVFQNLLSAESKGRYFNEYVKKVFEWKQVK